MNSEDLRIESCAGILSALAVVLASFLASVGCVRGPRHSSARRPDAATLPTVSLAERLAGKAEALAGPLDGGTHWELAPGVTGYSIDVSFPSDGALKDSRRAQISIHRGSEESWTLVVDHAGPMVVLEDKALVLSHGPEGPGGTSLVGLVPRLDRSA